MKITSCTYTIAIRALFSICRCRLAVLSEVANIPIRDRRRTTIGLHAMLRGITKFVERRSNLIFDDPGKSRHVMCLHSSLPTCYELCGNCPIRPYILCILRILYAASHFAIMNVYTLITVCCLCR